MKNKPLENPRKSATAILFKNCFLLSLIIFCTKCSVYSPPISLPVVIDKKGQMQIDGSISISNVMSDPILLPVGIHGSFAYGIADNVSFQFSGSRQFKSHNHFETSLGYYHPFNENLKVGIFPGLNYGNVFLSDENIRFNGSWVPPEQWRGNYFTPNTRLQFLAESRMFRWGFGLKTGVFMPDLTVNNYKRQFPNALLLEPMLFVMPTIFDSNYSITLCTSLTQLFPIENGNILFSDKYTLAYDKITFSVGFIYTFSK